jgi:hypothetical protein
MGSSPYVYLVPYQPNFQRALDELREREFESGRYHPAVFMPPELVDDRTPPGPGRQHDTIEEALDAADADGTRSILDIDRVGNEDDFGIARRLTEEELEDLFGTATPTREQVLELMPPEDGERGQAVCLPVYDNAGFPVEIFFGGWSCD